MAEFTATNLPEDSTLWGKWKGDGPVHVVTGGVWGQAWCGARPNMSHGLKPAGTPVTCPTCLRRLALGRPQARR